MTTKMGIATLAGLLELPPSDMTKALQRARAEVERLEKLQTKQAERRAQLDQMRSELARVRAATDQEHGEPEPELVALRRNISAVMEASVRALQAFADDDNWRRVTWGRGGKEERIWVGPCDPVMLAVAALAGKRFGTMPWEGGDV